MIKGTTSSGFSYSVSEKLANDFRFVRAFARVNRKDTGDAVSGAVDLLVIALGEDGMEALCKHVQEEDGTVPTDRVMAELGEILAAVGEKDGGLKN